LTAVLDAGALVAIERGDRDLLGIIWSEVNAGRPAITHGGVIGQVWRRGSARQVRLARALAGIRVRSIDAELGRRAGELLGRARETDVTDAALVLIAEDGDEIYSADAQDLRHLADVAGKVVHLVPV
jgi:hypothetical protein